VTGRGSVVSSRKSDREGGLEVENTRDMISVASWLGGPLPRGVEEQVSKADMLDNWAR
jgi:hypothetical protein